MFAIPHILEIRNIAITKNNTKPMIVGNISDQNLSFELSLTIIFVGTFGFFSHNSVRESVAGNIMISLFIFSTQLTNCLAHDKVAIALFQSIKISLYEPELNFCSSKFREIVVSWYVCHFFIYDTKLANIKAKNISTNIDFELFCFFIGIFGNLGIFGVFFSAIFYLFLINF
ncbi:MAG: hypothetical protein EOM78_22020 [Erysipelotrichia bacterium]|nr:hypothetical protein [Erysipelotrichia bacterium]